VDEAAVAVGQPLQTAWHALLAAAGAYGGRTAQQSADYTVPLQRPTSSQASLAVHAPTVFHRVCVLLVLLWDGEAGARGPAAEMVATAGSGPRRCEQIPQAGLAQQEGSRVLQPAVSRRAPASRAASQRRSVSALLPRSCGLPHTRGTHLASTHSTPKMMLVAIEAKAMVTQMAAHCLPSSTALP